MTKRENKQERLVRMTQYEQAHWSAGVRVGGVDEAGRGPLAGPVVAACAVLPPEPLLLGINDSKKLTPARREALYERILETATSYGIAEVDALSIEVLNIREATRLAMVQAIALASPDRLLVDAERNLDTRLPQEAIIRGDAASYLIAAASILAKVHRDRLMLAYDEQYPAYGFAKHKGYGTAAHIEAIRKYGPCPLHRPLYLRRILSEA